MSQRASRVSKARTNLLAAGLSDDLANRAIEQRISLSKLRRYTNEELSKDFSDEEIRFIRDRLQRKKIPARIVFRLLDESNGKCCVCWDYYSDSPVIFHHITEHSKTADDTYENLVVLCLNCHDRAHRNQGLSRSRLLPEIIRKRKLEWVGAVAQHRNGERPPPGYESPEVSIPKPQPPPVGKPLIGRSGILDSVCDWLVSTPQPALLVGMGGVGKTVLALKVANELVANFGGGVLWASLGEQNGDVEAVLRLWTKIIGIEPPVGFSSLEYVERLRAWIVQHEQCSGRILFVLDDARIEWLEGIRLVVRAIPEGCAVLITSREKAVGNIFNAKLIDVEPLGADDAAELLQFHADVSSHYFDSKAIAEAGKLLGNLPLAIELLGKHIAVLKNKPNFDLDILIAHLRKERLNRLNLPGHVGLMSVFSLSYNALTDLQKRAFRYVGLYASTLVPLEHFAKIIQIATESVEETLDHLVLVSLMNWSPGSYRVHPLLRDYAILLSGRKKAEANRARRAYFYHFASIALKWKIGQEPALWEGVLSEIVHGVETAGMGAPETVLALADHLSIQTDILRIRGHFRQAVVLLEAAITAAKRLGQPVVAAAHTGNLASAYSVLGENDRAKHLYHRALAILDTTDDQYDRPAFLGNLGMILQREGDWKHAHQHYEQALRTAISVGNVEVAIDQINNLGSLLRHRDPEEARKTYDLGLRILGSTGDSRRRAAFMSNLGLLDFDNGELGQAELRITEALEMARCLGDRQSEANRLGHLGNIAAKREDYVAARHFFQAAVDINHEIGYKAREADWLSNLGMTKWYIGEQMEGLADVRGALGLSVTSGHREAEGLNHIRLAEMLLDLGEVASSRLHEQEGIRILRTVESPIRRTSSNG